MSAFEGWAAASGAVGGKPEAEVEPLAAAGQPGAGPTSPAVKLESAAAVAATVALEPAPSTSRAQQTVKEEQVEVIDLVAATEAAARKAALPPRPAAGSSEVIDLVGCDSEYGARSSGAAAPSRQAAPARGGGPDDADSMIDLVSSDDEDEQQQQQQQPQQQQPEQQPVANAVEQPQPLPAPQQQEQQEPAAIAEQQPQPQDAAPPPAAAVPLRLPMRGAGSVRPKAAVKPRKPVPAAATASRLEPVREAAPAPHAASGQGITEAVARSILLRGAAAGAAGGSGSKAQGDEAGGLGTPQLSGSRGGCSLGSLPRCDGSSEEAPDSQPERRQQQEQQLPSTEVVATEEAEPSAGAAASVGQERQQRCRNVASRTVSVSVEDGMDWEPSPAAPTADSGPPPARLAVLPAAVQQRQEQQQDQPPSLPSGPAPSGEVVVVDEEEEEEEETAVRAAVGALVVACEAQAAADASRQQAVVPAATQQQQQQQQQTPPRSPLKAGPTSPGLMRLMQSVMALKHKAPAATASVGPGPSVGSATPARHPAPGASAAAAAAAGAGGAAGPSAVPASPAAAGGEDAMPDPSDAGAMLRWARSRILPAVLEQYREPHAVSAEDAAEAQGRLEAYFAEMERVKDSGSHEKKFDLVAACNLEKRLHPEWGIWGNEPGHKPGVAVGQRFKGRGDIQAMGIHTSYYSGIQRTSSSRGGGKKNGKKEEGPALAICLSGGYQDDDDRGDWFWYTGQGGRDTRGVQVNDQKWQQGNLGLRLCFERGVPVRVVRAVAHGQEGGGKKGKQGADGKEGADRYSYDGLYCVVHASRVPSGEDGPLVCRFLCVGVPGHYKANKSVSWVELRGFRNVRLAAGDSEEDEEEEEEDEEVVAPRSKRARTQKSQGASTSAAAAARKPSKPKAGGRAAGSAAAPRVVQDAAWLAALKRRPGFLCADVSGGRERRKIPAFNEVDGEGLPPDFVYVRDSMVGSAAAAQMIEEGRRVMPSRWCGLEMGRKGPAYNRLGCMLMTLDIGQWECCDRCTKLGCRRNRVISDVGLRLPLELFRTHYKGWGVRCAADIPAGSFICSYEGEIITNEEAEQRGDADSYLFDLSHFLLMHIDANVPPRDRARLPSLPCEPTEDAEHLVIDAHETGSVARFINHSCAPNLVTQPVLRQGDSAMRYCVGIFAAEDIKRGTELTYNYGYRPGTVAGKELQCHCGAPCCQGRLI